MASASKSEHLSHLRTLFERLSEHGLIDCTIDFLGHRVTKEGAVPLPAKVEAIKGEPGVKFFVVDVGGKPDWISVDRLSL